jgi:hypothetical protein
MRQIVELDLNAGLVQRSNNRSGVVIVPGYSSIASGNFQCALHYSFSPITIKPVISLRA